MNRNLIATVGSNPLPVVIVARHLRPPRFWLLYTKSTQTVRRQIEALLDHGEVIPVEMGEGRSLREAVDELRTRNIEWGGADLNYTAGTKQMSVVAHGLWEEHNPPDSGAGACYLAPDGLLYWDDQEPEMLRPSLTLEDVASLHFEGEFAPSNAHRHTGKLQLAQRAKDFVVSREGGWEGYRRLLPPVYGSRMSAPPCPLCGASEGTSLAVDGYSAACEANFKDGSPWLGAFGSFAGRFLGIEGASLDRIASLFKEKPRSRKVAKWRLDTFKLLYSGWLEVWLADYLADSDLFGEVVHGFRVDPGGPREFELDVVALKGSRIFTFSCTVDQTKGLVKSKALEAHHRTQRIGGDHAAFAVFSLSEAPEKVFATIKEERWHGHDRARIFGFEHLRDTDKFREELEKWVQR